MPKQDYKVSLFIEQYDGHFSEFLEKREALLTSGKDKFIILANIKELEKELALYTIAVGKNMLDRKSTRLNSSHVLISYAVFCLKKKK